MLRDEAIALEDERDERRSWRLVAVNDAIDSVLRNLSEDLFVPVWDARDGGLAEPEFDLGLPLDVEEWSGLDVTEGPGEPRFDDDPVPLGEATTTVHVDVSLRFEGFMTKADWYASTGNDDVQLWDSDWNDHYVVVEGERSVTLDIEEAEIVGATVERGPTD